MNSILKQLKKMSEADLYVLSDAVDSELLRRDDVGGEVSDSARRRAVERGQSYRHRVGAGAPPVRIVGIGRANPDKRAA
jgi:hypothetical protein